jgi:hypothetical protein
MRYLMIMTVKQFLKGDEFRKIFLGLNRHFETYPSVYSKVALLFLETPFDAFMAAVVVAKMDWLFYARYGEQGIDLAAEKAVQTVR